MMKIWALSLAAALTIGAGVITMVKQASDDNYLKLTVR
jgi:hypothetical protein